MFGTLGVRSVGYLHYTCIAKPTPETCWQGIHTQVGGTARLAIIMHKI